MMRINNQPLVPQAELERAQGEIDSLYVQIVDLHAEIAGKEAVIKADTVQNQERLRAIAILDNLLTEERKKNKALEAQVKELETVKRILEQYKKRNQKPAKKVVATR